MDLISWLLNIDKFVIVLLEQHIELALLVLFLIVFVETGIVIFPFLPGDSLIFLVGATVAQLSLNIYIAGLVLLTAAILGDQVNFYLGSRWGRKLWTWNKIKFLNEKKMAQTIVFFQKYGLLSIVLARWLPFLRTFIPFVAGMSFVQLWDFTRYNVLGAVLWIGGLLTLGHSIGHLPLVQDNLEYIFLGFLLIPGCIALAGVFKLR